MSDGAISGEQQTRKVVGRPFQKGISGNPQGRPAVVKDIQAMCRERTPQALAALTAALGEPRERVAAAQVLMAYGYGKPIQRNELSGPDGGPIQMQTEDTRLSIDLLIMGALTNTQPTIEGSAEAASAIEETKSDE